MTAVPPRARYSINFIFTYVLDLKGFNCQLLPIEFALSRSYSKLRNPFSYLSKAQCGVRAYVDYELFGELACKSR